MTRASEIGPVCDDSGIDRSLHSTSSPQSDQTGDKRHSARQRECSSIEVETVSPAARHALRNSLCVEPDNTETMLTKLDLLGLLLLAPASGRIKCGVRLFLLN